MEPLSDLKVRQALCETHGAFEARRWFNDLWSECPACAKAERDRSKAEARETQRAEFIANAVRESGLIGRFRQSTLSAFTATTREQRKAVRMCQEFAAAATPNSWSTLALIGQPGTGKTHLGAGMVLDVISREKWAQYTTFRDLIRTLRSTWRRDSDKTEEEVINSFAGGALLVIDEIGVGFGTEAEAAQLFDVIDRRYQWGNPVVLISNLAIPEMRLALGDRLYDRIRESGQVVPCTWPSHRGTP